MEKGGQPKLPSNHNAHHVLYYKRHFDSYPDTHELREHPVLVIPMNQYDHGTFAYKGKKDGIHFDHDIRPLSKDKRGDPILPSETFVRLALVLCDIHEPMPAPHVERLRNFRDELDRLVFDQTIDSDTRRESWRFSCNISQQLTYITRRPLLDRKYWSWRHGIGNE